MTLEEWYTNSQPLECKLHVTKQFATKRVKFLGGDGDAGNYAVRLQVVDASKMPLTLKYKSRGFHAERSRQKTRPSGV